MTTISFYARGDGSSANNSALNVENISQQPSVLLTFDSGPSGDIVLEYNGGAADPDTTVIINGSSYNFTVEATGILPVGNGKVPVALQGEEITIISVVINGTTERFFFVNDGSGTLALMDQFGNGGIPLSSANFTPPPILICFANGTELLTPTGSRKVEMLKIGDLVQTDIGEAKPILWIACTEISVAQMLCLPALRPIRIPAHAVRPGVPYADLYVSAQHRVVLNGASTQLLFGEPAVLVAAKHLVHSLAEQILPKTAVRYYHILLEDHDIVLSNGLASESFQPSINLIAELSPALQCTLFDALSAHNFHQYCKRPDAMPTLNWHEAKVLTGRWIGNLASQDDTDTAFPVGSRFANAG